MVLRGTTFILVAAPDASFRHSLVFALESDDYSVHAFRYAEDAFVSAYVHKAACAVIDDDAVRDWDQVQEQFSRFAKPVILLVDQFRKAPELPAITPLMKPYLGAPLIKAVRNAITDLE
ncbi:response regulator transcription factor [Pseudaminobacter sp. NGMCC 1.201702]|uniref:hypothetical protein n=1 Tax=Pseudaminobacter sp. NGMCC 1.201702 TaxID=3391825 RepID=UPI0039F10699